MPGTRAVSARVASHAISGFTPVKKGNVDSKPDLKKLAYIGTAIFNVIDCHAGTLQF